MKSKKLSKKTSKSAPLNLLAFQKQSNLEKAKKCVKIHKTKKPALRQQDGPH